MNCEIARALLCALQDGELGAETTLLLEEHLSTCTACTAFRLETADVLALANCYSTNTKDILTDVMAGIELCEHFQNMVPPANLQRELAEMQSHIKALQNEVAVLMLAQRRSIVTRSETLLLLPDLTVSTPGTDVNNSMGDRYAAPERNRKWN